MKLPNGYGSVSKLSGRRRRPFIVRVNRKILGYTSTREEGLELLADYHKQPWDIDKRKATFKDVYELLIQDRTGKVSNSTIASYKGKYKHCEAFYDIPYAELRTHHFASIIDSKEKTYGTKLAMRKFFRAMDKTAMDHDIILKSYSESLPNYEPDTYTERIPFSEEEIKILWANLDIEDVDLVLMLIYLGMRIGEFADLKIKDIDFDKHILKGGNKTKAGKNRIIPIHPKIEPLIADRISRAEGETLLNYGIQTIRKRFNKVMEKLKMSHIPHECRHTLRTRLDNLNINSNIINLILGHQGKGVGERIYTHKTLDQLKAAILALD